ncbi:unnamed protein product [Adineta steineri]|uniref:Uncharacterized protein n=1 Tax=Adineta steineri TaxID=433720 RepID=A0A818JUW7_9BILA|nr:unnamed protein product [Adineta steineri]CAF3545662.1 unnamed protein product [Adineta steineri]
MRQMQLYLVIFNLVFIPCIYTQIPVDPQLCPEGATSPTLDPYWHAIPSRFEIMTELVLNTGVIDVSQAFSSQRDAIITNSPQGTVQSYWNFDTNEHFEVLTNTSNPLQTPKCVRQVIDTTSETTVYQSNTLMLKPSALLGFDGRNQINPLWGIQYDGDEDLRGIPTNRFKSCFYLDDIKATVSATYYISNVKKFQSYLPANQSIILQIDVRVKNYLSKMNSYTYNVFRYIPNPNRRQERQALETPAGVFCPNRTSILSLPTDIPERITINSESFIPEVNSSIYSSHGLFDNEFQFTRLDLWYPDPSGGPIWSHFTEIHDFGTGLAYNYNHTTRQCMVNDINTFFGDAESVEGQPNLVQMGSPQHLIVMDDITNHYTGEKRCRDRVWCHVWIGEKKYPNNTVQHQEWYWASTFNGEPLQRMIPMKMVWKTYVNDVLTNAVESTMFNYRRNPNTVFEIDFALADCYRALGPDQKFNLAVLSFKIGNDKKYPVFENINYLRLHIFETLMYALHIRPIRISNLIVDQDDSNENILVTFTLLDAPPRTGPVEVPIKETSLDTLIERLNSAIDSNTLTFRARTSTKQIILRARISSLNIQHQSTQEKVRSTGPKITGLWIGFIIVGVLVGGVGGFFLLAKMATS